MIADCWIAILATLRDRRQSCVLITVLQHRGSVPRDSGTKMVVTADAQYLTIGGGHLEYQCIARARAMLAEGTAQPLSERFPLGARLGQCCGGMAEVLFEPLRQCQPHIAIFGAGHVGQALVAILQTLPCHIYWADSRTACTLPAVAGVSLCLSDDPLAQVAAMPVGSYYVVMTHDHGLDLQLTEAILRRDDARYVGLIGSQTKRQRFDYRLAGKGIAPAQLATLRCPIGLAEVRGKRPAEIAVSVAAEIIACYQTE
ncbi:xanthine dehydrogenase accessory protein XdhC [Pantoea sp. 1.19]|uniref:xanthine dehydrogenase accessory protein XdhC n=1 Tax=Pantoea sp. 1.19 TaxID=1925589 RepID=UPI000948BFED|nr:xanthine dehydrogenase accessory protein XdhC [Pantoea sp. 1.19]